MTFISVFILFCSFHLKEIQNAPSHYQIDDFIVQLMTSEKFNELADIIAERAARKIKTVEDGSVTTLRHSYHSDKPKNKKYNKEKPLHDRKDSILRERKTDDEKSGKFGKINTKAFLKHDISSQELYLNYKHMTKELKRNKTKNASAKKERNSNRNDKFSDHSTEQAKDKAVNNESNERKNIKMKSQTEENIGNIYSISSNVIHDTVKNKNLTNKTVTSKKKINKTEPSSQEVSGEDRTQEIPKKDNSGEKSKKPSTTQTTKNIIGDTSSDSTDLESKKDITDHSDRTKESQEHKSRNYSSKEVVEVGINRALSDNDNDNASEHHSDTKLDFTVDSNEKFILKKPAGQKVVRRENGKLYTFISSPDYNDYHENVAQLKSRNHFINTYRYK